MVADQIPEQVWVLRSACGCPHGASTLTHGEDRAWRELASGKPSEVARLVGAGWTLRQEPGETAVPDVRARLGQCRHPEGKADVR